jgi:hypothetical protein
LVVKVDGVNTIAAVSSFLVVLGFSRHWDLEVLRREGKTRPLQNLRLSRGGSIYTVENAEISSYSHIVVELDDLLDCSTRAEVENLTKEKEKIDLLGRTYYKEDIEDALRGITEVN